MWVLTENGRLINLDRFYAVDVRFSEATGHQVVARSEHEILVVLCSCDNEEHGTEIVQHIADALEAAQVVKVHVYFCQVCDQRFEVPRRGGNVHFLRGKLVCPDCWAAGQAEAAGGAAQ